MGTEQILYLILISILSGWVFVFYVRTRNRKTDKWSQEMNTKRRTSSGVYIDGLTDKEWEKHNGR